MCAYCAQPARKNEPRMGVRRWYRTCGSQKCLSELYRDTTVDVSRRLEGRSYICELCHTLCVGRYGGRAQKWCKACVPNRTWETRVRCYGIGTAQWNALLLKQGGTCALCTDLPTVVDHSHKTGNVRGLLCSSCNMHLVGLGAHVDWFKKAQEYRHAVP